MSLGNLSGPVTRPDIDEFLNGLPDQEMAYLVVEATRVVKRRLARGQGRGLRTKGSGMGKAPLDEAIRRVAGESTEFEDPGETW